MLLLSLLHCYTSIFATTKKEMRKHQKYLKPKKKRLNTTREKKEENKLFLSKINDIYGKCNCNCYWNCHCNSYCKYSTAHRTLYNTVYCTTVNPVPILVPFVKFYYCLSNFTKWTQQENCNEFMLFKPEFPKWAKTSLLAF